MMLKSKKKNSTHWKKKEKNERQRRDKKEEKDKEQEEKKGKRRSRWKGKRKKNEVQEFWGGKDRKSRCTGYKIVINAFE